MTGSKSKSKSHEIKAEIMLHRDGRSNRFKIPKVQPTPFEEIPSGNHEYPSTESAPLLHGIVDAIKEDTGAQLELIASTALPMMAACVQGHANVELFPATETPTSLIITGTARSGSGKSTVERRITKAARDEQNKANRIWEEDYTNYQFELNLYNIERQEIEKKIRKAFKGKKDTSAFKAELQELSAKKPKRPPEPRFIFESSTSAGQRLGLEENPVSAFQLSSEGGNALNGEAMNDYAFQNSLWDGGEISRDTATKGNKTLIGARLTSLTLVQMEIHNKYIERNGRLARHSGYQARALTANFEQGMWRYSNDKEFDMSRCIPFYNRVRELMNIIFQKLRSGNREIQRDLLQFTKEGKASILGIRNSLLHHMSEGGIYEHARDHAAKIPENIARVAATIHYFERYPGNIGYQTVQFAKNIVFWHSFQFLEHFSIRPEEDENADLLLRWFQEQLTPLSVRYIPVNPILQYGPNSLRKKEKLFNAIDKLKEKGCIFELSLPRKNGQQMRVLDTMPGIPPNDEKLYHDLEVQPRFKY